MITGQQTQEISLYNQLESARSKNTPVIHPKNPNYFVSVGQNFYTFTHNDYRDSPYNKTEYDSGWKFHIGIDDRDPDNLANGCNIVAQILMSHNINQFKLVTSEAHFSTQIREGEDQRGKQITIYANKGPNHNDPAFWGPILEEIDTALRTAGVDPEPDTVAELGARTNREYKVKDNRYARYRNDKGLFDKIDPVTGAHMYHRNATDTPNTHWEFDPYKSLRDRKTYPCITSAVDYLGDIFWSRASYVEYFLEPYLWPAPPPEHRTNLEGNEEGDQNPDIVSPLNPNVSQESPYGHYNSAVLLDCFHKPEYEPPSVLLHSPTAPAKSQSNNSTLTLIQDHEEEELKNRP